MIQEEITAAPPRGRPRRRWLWLLLLPLGLVALLLAMVVALDTGPGHRLLTDRLERFRFATGLRVRVGRIDGSIYDRATLRDVRFYDGKGLFLNAPELRLDWRPWAWTANKLDIRSLVAPTATLHRLPELRRRAPLTLPSFDVAVSGVRIDRLRISEGVIGPERTGAVSGRVELRRGKALVAARVATDAGDWLDVALDADPRAGRFDMSGDVNAPAQGLLGRMAGLKAPLAARIGGKGDWRAWDGRANVRYGGTPLADLALGVRAGELRLTGGLRLADVLDGLPERLAGDRVTIDARGRITRGIATGGLSLRSAMASVQARGGYDLRRARFDAVMIDAVPLRPEALLRNMRARDLRLKAMLDGDLRTARFAYVLTAPMLGFDKLTIDRMRAEGAGRLSSAPLVIPLRLSAARVTGAGAEADGLLTNLRVDGRLRATRSGLSSDDLRIVSDKLTSRGTLIVDFATGTYDLRLAGQLTRYFVRGVGLVDVRTTLSLAPGANRMGIRAAGRIQAWVRRFDNAFLQTLAGGLPVLDADFTRDRDGVIRFSRLRVTGPAVSFTGSGLRRVNGTMAITGTGTQKLYGPLKLALDGPLQRPRLDILLLRPIPALAVVDARVLLDPTPAGYSYRANGASVMGPWTGRGAILLTPGRPARIGVEALEVRTQRAAGELVSVGTGLDGMLRVSGGGLIGTVRFDKPDRFQRIGITLAASDARFDFDGPNYIRRGTIQGEVTLDPAGAILTGSVKGQGFRRALLSLAQFEASGTIQNWLGKITLSGAGSRGRAFDVKVDADLQSDRVTIAGTGTVDRRPIRIDKPAVLMREGDGYRLAPTVLNLGGGRVTLAALVGQRETALDAGFAALPLTILDVVKPDLGLGGTATGRLQYRALAGAAPSGTMDVNVRRLTRASYALAAKPLDIAIKAGLNGNQAAMRAIVAADGREVGRAQARLSPLATGGDLADRLFAAPLFAQLRYAGPADTLWRLTGVQQFDLAGAVAVAADVTGRIGDPVIRGSVRTSNARLESPVSGTVLTALSATGRFNGSRLLLDKVGAKAGAGTVSATGTVEFGTDDRGIDLRVRADNAELINRDEIGANVTGDLRIQMTQTGGLISGDVRLPKSRYRFGRTRYALPIARLKVEDRNLPADFDETGRAQLPIRLDIRARAANNLAVQGLGLSSEWDADLRLAGTLEAPIITGIAGMRRGTYEFASREFRLDRGVIRFNGLSPPDPIVDMTATANMQGLSATVRVTGTATKPEPRFESVPSLPPEELLSRLLFGSKLTELSAPEALQLTSAVTALQSGGGLDPINSLRRAVGLDRLRILSPDITIGQRTAVAAGKYLTRSAYVEVITDGQGYSASRAEFQLTRWLSVLSTVSTIGRHSATLRVSRDY